jgi:hypothetical protein
MGFSARGKFVVYGDVGPPAEDVVAVALSDGEEVFPAASNAETV